LAIVWNIECYHYHFYGIEGWLQPLNCVGAISLIWTTWWWTQDPLWTHGFKGCQDINLFYVFLDSFSIPNAHNMLTLMLDLVFKRLKFDYLAHERAKLMATKYDRKILLPMLVKCNQFLNLLISSTFPPPTEWPSNSLCDVLASCKEARKIVNS